MLHRLSPVTFEPTRKAGLERLNAFAPHAGRAYASGRNTDMGNPEMQAVSMVSPYVRRRMVTEPELIAEALKYHSATAAEKFIQEVVWRTYWKGWLEMRPIIWDRYLAARAQSFEDLDKDGALRRDYHAAITGETGIEGFDDWAQELVSTGYLHNHARMWFASIWIFTLRLPWALGADFFYRHLVDADPASNTLGWRWVAGLHTKGKTYLARADNIDQHTAGRFRPTGLAPFAEPLIEAEDMPAPLPPREGEMRVPTKGESGDYAVLLTSDDLYPDGWPGFENNVPAAVIALGQTADEAALNSGDIAASFTRNASANAAKRISREYHSDIADLSKKNNIGDSATQPNIANDVVGANAQDVERVLSACESANLTQLMMPLALTGPTKNFRDALRQATSLRGITLTEIQRRWDANAFPYATAGFFKMKKQIPKLLAKADLVG
ncbi:MAG: FAD-binding domain-containing protein [Pseudomonadota bacterium]